jgi:PXPV repeat (3 copies)/WXXGXW repeat (2 copies)
MGKSVWIGTCAAALAAAAAMIASPAHAEQGVRVYPHGVRSHGTGPVFVQPGPVFVQPGPVIVQPHPVRTWVPGHWVRHHHGHVWVDGHWIVTHPGQHVQPHFGGFHGDHHARRFDQDRDGIPNRFDRDIDGDGVPNWRDRAPRNHWR